MPLLEMFRSKPRWQHSDPNVRAEAVRMLGAEEQTALAEIARGDADGHVRRLAIKKLTSIELLAEIARSDSDAGAREEAQAVLAAAVSGEGDANALAAALDSLTDGRVLAIVAKTARLEAVRRAALARLNDGKALAQVAREASDAALRLAALERVTDAALRASVATGSEHRDVAIAALESLTDRAVLKTIAARAKLKLVARRARALMEERGGQTEAMTAPERHSRQSQVCHTIEALVHSKHLADVGEQLSAAEDEWRRLAPCADDALVSRYEAAWRVVRAALDRIEADGRDRARAEEEKGAALTARRALCEQAEGLSGADALARLADVEAAWAALAATTDPGAEQLAQRFAQAVAACRGRAQSETDASARDTRREELCREIETLAAGDPAAARARLGALEKEWRALAAGPADEKAQRFDAARVRCEERVAAERAARAEQEQQQMAQLSQLVQRLEGLAAATEPSLREASRCLREAGAIAGQLAALPARREREALLARLEGARKTLYPRVQALRTDEEWKRWANLSVCEELCQEIETLSGVEDLDEVARRIKDIDARWKTARELPREQAEALRERYRKSHEAVSQRLEAHFTKLEAERSENLKRKETLCERAESLAQSSDWARTAEAVRKLQEEWQGIGPVPRDQSDAIWRRFRAACEQFFTRFKAHRQARSAEWAENQKRKEALCERAETLSASSDWEPTQTEIRALQEQWKQIGAVRRSQSDALWKRFRAACDAFYERYKRRDEISAAANLATCEELCRGIEALVPQGGAVPEPPPDLAQQLGALQDAWRKASRGAGAAVAPLAERCERACLALITAFPAAFAGSELDPQLTLRRMEKLCARAEALCAQCAPAAGGADVADLARQLQSALAANAMGGQAEREARWTAARAEVDDLQASWKRLGPVPVALSEPLVERFRGACERFFGMRPAGSRPARSHAQGHAR